MILSHWRTLATTIVVSLLALVASASAAAQTKLTLWSHWADQDSKVAFVTDAVKRFEAKHPGVKV